MKAFLLAAGQGKRLLPLTESKPKSLLEVKGKPLILWNMEKLRDAGIDQLVINLFYEGEQIKDFLGNGSKFGIEIDYSFEQELLGTGGGIGKALNKIGEEPFILVSSDIWTDFNFLSLSLAHEALAHLVLIENPSSNSKGDMFLQAGIVKPQGPGKKLTFSGLAIIDPRIFKNTLKGNYDLWESVILPASEKGLVTGEFFQGSLININTVKDLEKLDALLTEE